MPTLDTIVKLISAIVTVGGGGWCLFGVIVLAGGLHDKSGPEIQKGLWQMLGGFIICAAAVWFGKIDTSGTKVSMDIIFNYYNI